MCGVGSDDRAGQVHRVQQVPDLGDLVGVVGNAVLGDDHAVTVKHRGEQLDLPAGGAAQPLAIDRDRGQGFFKAPRGGQGGQPAADEHVQRGGVKGLQQGADPLLAGGGDPPAQRVRRPAECGQQLLRQVSSLVACFPEVPRPGKRAHCGHRQHEHQAVAPAPPPPWVRDLREHPQQARDLATCAGSGISGRRYARMRNWHRWPLVRA